MAARTLATVCSLAVVLLGCAATSAQPLVPLPHDKQIRVYVGVWDRFYSPYHQTKRYLQLTANVAAYHPVEQPRVQTFDERRILTLQVPDEGGWAHFYADEDTIKLVFRVEDRRNRLGKLRLMAFGKGFWWASRLLTAAVRVSRVACATTATSSITWRISSPNGARCWRSC